MFNLNITNLKIIALKSQIFMRFIQILQKCETTALKINGVSMDKKRVRRILIEKLKIDPGTDG